jgi:hypothetical protein
MPTQPAQTIEPPLLSGGSNLFKNVPLTYHGGGCFSVEICNFGILGRTQKST